jgi:K+-transporting ATPase ATPase C chain
MGAHLRANLWLLGLTVLICCVLYPLVLWGLGQAFFPTGASGSLVTDGDKVVGSRLIAQPFSAPKYFQPRPSAASYNAAASGGSNFGASNPKLRGRVAQQLGLIARYKKDGPRKGDPVGPDVEKWFREQTAKKRDLVSEWAEKSPTLAGVWATSSDLVKEMVSDYPGVKAAWKADNPAATAEPGADDLALHFFKSYAKNNFGKWPKPVEVEEEGKKVKRIDGVTEGDEVRSTFFDMWLQENPKGVDPLKDLEQVPADLVMTSGSGLDPHITLRNARYQLDGVVAARAEESKKDRAEVRRAVEAVLQRHSFRPLWGLAGEELVNVLEVNRALDAELKK